MAGFPQPSMLYSNASVTSSTITPVWTIWNVTSGTTTSATLSVWGNWNATAITSATTSTMSITTNGIAWEHWVKTSSATLQRIITGAPAIVRQRSEAEIQRQLQEDADWRRRQEEETAMRIAAKGRAERLLLGALGPEQRKDLTEKNCFYLHTQSGRRYRIDRGTHGNVKLVDEKNGVISRFCAQPPGVPAEDAMLAQKLMLETDEQSFLRVANETRMR